MAKDSAVTSAHGDPALSLSGSALTRRTCLTFPESLPLGEWKRF
ncbi:hypothetical protein ACIPSA_12465 [Streptomyces sp. NPDC086549]